MNARELFARRRPVTRPPHSPADPQSTGESALQSPSRIPIERAAAHRAAFPLRRIAGLRPAAAPPSLIAGESEAHRTIGRATAHRAALPLCRTAGLRPAAAPPRQVGAESATNLGVGATAPSRLACIRSALRSSASSVLNDLAARGTATIAAFSALAFALLSGCAVGPEYHRATALGTNALPATFSARATETNGVNWKPAAPAADLPRGPWWEVFGDAELDRLETLLNSGNQELAAALARFEQARALVNVARSDLFPQLSATPSYARVRSSAGVVDRGQPIGTGYNYHAITVPLDASWEADLWGRIRKQVEAARARLDAGGDDLAAARLAAQAELATDYFTLRALDAEYDLIERTVDAYTRSLTLTRNRRAGGVATEFDVAQAETQLKTTQAQVPAVDLERAKLRHAIATLCGQAATGFALREGNAPTAIPAVPVSLPSELLERRPDVAAAERRMAAANADVGFARTAFYPRIQFNGLAGFQSVNAGALFDWPSRFWSIGPSLELPIFTGGRNQAQLAAARAAYDETVANYRQTVLSAFQEVEDQLAAQSLLTTQLEAEQSALTAARRTLEIAENRYKAGLVTYLDVAISQSAALDHERSVVQLRAQRLAASAALAKAMGGGWRVIAAIRAGN